MWSRWRWAGGPLGSVYFDCASRPFYLNANQFTQGFSNYPSVFNGFYGFFPSRNWKPSYHHTTKDTDSLLKMEQNRQLKIGEHVLWERGKGYRSDFQAGNSSFGRCAKQPIHQQRFKYVLIKHLNFVWWVEPLSNQLLGRSIKQRASRRIACTHNLWSALLWLTQTMRYLPCVLDLRIPLQLFWIS